MNTTNYVNNKKKLHTVIVRLSYSKSQAVSYRNDCSPVDHYIPVKFPQSSASVQDGDPIII